MRSSLIRFTALLVASCTVACVDRPLPIPTDGGGGDAAPSCKLPTPLCVQSCSGGASFGNATCNGEAWSCTIGILSTMCKGIVCWGSAPRAEVCGASGWECRPATDDYELCPALMCTTCNAFGGSVTVDGCACTCVGDQVVCQHAFPQ